MLYQKLNKLLEDYGRGGQRRLAEFLNETPTNVNRYAKGKREIPTSLIPKIAEFFNVSTDYLHDINTIKVKQIPLIGIASCGVPSQAYDDIIEYIPVPDKFARDSVYAVTADGDSMLPRIAHGDIVMCDKDAPCENGNIVHYTTNDGESGLKKFMLKDGVITLYPLNTDGFTPIMVKEDELRCAKAIKIISDL